MKAALLAVGCMPLLDFAARWDPPMLHLLSTLESTSFDQPNKTNGSEKRKAKNNPCITINPALESNKLARSGRL